MSSDGEEKIYTVYILANRPHGALYVGVTGHLVQRTIEHKEGRFAGFTATYGIHRLVYFRTFGQVERAIRFEKQLKRWRRQWKINLIERDNPRWDDLFLQLTSPNFEVKPVFLDPDNPPDWFTKPLPPSRPQICHPGFAPAQRGRRPGPI